MKHFFMGLLSIGMLLAGGLVSGAPAQSLEDVLAKMDGAASTFQNAVAELDYTKVTVIVDDKSTEKGTIYFQRGKNKGDFKVKIDFREPSEKTVLFSGAKARIYRPAIKQVEEYDMGSNRQAVEQFLLLGFGTRGSDLARDYNVTLVGDARINNQDTVKLELLPKSQDVARHIKKVEVWLSRTNWQPVQQTFTEPTGDYLVAKYSSLKVNAALPSATFDLKLPSGVKTVRPAAD